MTPSTLSTGTPPFGGETPPFALDTEVPDDTERLLNEATGGCIGVELVQTSRTRDRANETDRRRDDLLSDRVSTELVELG